MKKFVICLLAFLICGCRRTIDFDFDTYKQSLHISNGFFYDLCFENDSVLPNGKSYEGALFLIWQDSLCVPPTKNLILESLKRKVECSIRNFTICGKSIS